LDRGRNGQELGSNVGRKELTFWEKLMHANLKIQNASFDAAWTNFTVCLVTSGSLVGSNSRESDNESFPDYGAFAKMLCETESCITGDVSLVARG